MAEEKKRENQEVAVVTPVPKLTGELPVVKLPREALQYAMSSIFEDFNDQDKADEFSTLVCFENTMCVGALIERGPLSMEEVIITLTDVGNGRLHYTLERANLIEPPPFHIFPELFPGAILIDKRDQNGFVPSDFVAGALTVLATMKAFYAQSVADGNIWTDADYDDLQDELPVEEDWAAAMVAEDEQPAVATIEGEPATEVTEDNPTAEAAATETVEEEQPAPPPEGEAAN